MMPCDRCSPKEGEPGNLVREGKQLAGLEEVSRAKLTEEQRTTSVGAMSPVESDHVGERIYRCQDCGSLWRMMFSTIDKSSVDEPALTPIQGSDGWAIDFPGIVVKRFADAETFLDALNPSSSIWGKTPDAWIFRGHADARWFLSPKAHRREPWEGLAKNSDTAFNPSAATEQQRMDQEGAILQAFLEALDASGIVAPIEYRMLGSIAGIGNERPLALAQHYGLPTRLLDWTRNALFATFFACLKPKAKCDDLAVWAVDTRALRSVPTDVANCQLVHSTRADNPNLHAQEGLFTCVTQASGAPLTNIALLRLDQVVSMVATRGLAGGATRPEPTMRKFVLARTLDEPLMELLHRRRVYAGRLFPGLLGVAMTVQERMRFGVPREVEF